MGTELTPSYWAASLSCQSDYYRARKTAPTSMEWLFAWMETARAVRHRRPLFSWGQAGAGCKAEEEQVWTSLEMAQIPQGCSW